MVTPYAEEITRYHQCGFRRNRITAFVKYLKKRERAEAVPGLIMDLKTAYDSVRREVFLIKFSLSYSLRTDRSGDRILLGTRFSASVHDPVAHITSTAMGTGPLSRG